MYWIALISVSSILTYCLGEQYVRNSSLKNLSLVCKNWWKIWGILTKFFSVPIFLHTTFICYTYIFYSSQKSHFSFLVSMSSFSKSRTFCNISPFCSYLSSCPHIYLFHQHLPKKFFPKEMWKVFMRFKMFISVIYWTKTILWLKL